MRLRLNVLALSDAPGQSTDEAAHPTHAARLIARLTWPIDVAAELMEAEDLTGVNPDFASLTRSQLEYKALLLRPGIVLDRLMDLLLPNLAAQTKCVCSPNVEPCACQNAEAPIVA